MFTIIEIKRMSEKMTNTYTKKMTNSYTNPRIRKYRGHEIQRKED